MLMEQYPRSTQNLAHGYHFAPISEDIYLFSHLTRFFRANQIHVFSEFAQYRPRLK